METVAQNIYSLTLNKITVATEQIQTRDIQLYSQFQ